VRSRWAAQVGNGTGALVSATELRSDLAGPADVHDLVVDFYREVVLDELLAPVFDEVAEVDWAEHIPRLVDYWNGILLDAGTRRGSVTAVHRQLHAAAPVDVGHCVRWLELWARCLAARWEGPNATRALEHARALMIGMGRHVFHLGDQDVAALELPGDVGGR
jgi:hemoglobin